MAPVPGGVLRGMLPLGVANAKTVGLYLEGAFLFS